MPPKMQLVAQVAFGVAFCSLLTSLPTAAAKKVIHGYYPSYAGQAASAIPYAKYTDLSWFVMTTTPTCRALSTAGISNSSISSFVSTAKANGISPTYTVGGYTGSQYFSPCVATAANRTVFANTLFATMKAYGFSGIILDWEYPASTDGQSDNIVSTADYQNVISFLSVLRSTVGSAVTIGWAGRAEGVNTNEGVYSTDLTAFAANLNYLYIMDYDFFGFYADSTGPNSPLYTGCAGSNDPYSIQTSVASHIKAGVPASKLVVGVPSYAYAYSVASPLVTRTCSGGSSVLYQFSGANYKGPATNIPNQLMYKEIVANGYASSTSWTKYNDAPSGGTLALWSSSLTSLLIYDDPSSFTTKARFVQAQGLAGMSMFDTNGDTSTGALIGALQAVLNPVAVSTTTSKPSTTVKTTTTSRLTTTSKAPTTTAKTTTTIAKTTAKTTVKTTAKATSSLPPGRTGGRRQRRSELSN